MRYAYLLAGRRIRLPAQIIGLLVGIMLGSRSSEAQYTANYQTNTISGVTSNWVGSAGYVVGSNYVFDALQITSSGVLSNGAGYIGYTVGGSNNNVLVTDTGSVWSNTSSIYVGNYGSGNSLVISNGGRVVIGMGRGEWNCYSYIGYDDNSRNNSVLVTDTGSVWTNSTYVNVGYQGSGNSLVISNRGNVFSKSGYIGNSSGSSNNSVLVSGSGSVWNSGDTLNAGYLGSGNSLVINNGGKVVNSYGFIGNNPGSSNNSVLVTGSGSVWGSTNLLYVGFGGAGNSLVISNGGRVVVIGIGSIGMGSPLIIGPGYGSSSSNNSVRVADGGVWQNNLLYVGFGGSSNSLMVAGGSVLATGLVVGVESTSLDNIVQLGGGNLAVTSPSGNAVLDIRRGTLTMNSGTITVDKLLLTNGASSVMVFDGGVLTTKKTTVANGAVLQFALGTNSPATAGVVVSSNLTLGGMLNITDAGGFTTGTYTLFTYTGALTYNGLTIGTTPDSSLSYTINTNTAGQVNLTVAPPPPVAGFSGGPTSGVAPLAVTFTDASTGNITNWFWDFGDGSTTNFTASTNPTHTYAAGTYTVSLTVSGLGGSNTNTLSNYIAAITPAHLVISPASCNYGTVAVDRSSSQTFSVINTGQQTLTGSASVGSPFVIVSGSSYSVPGNGTNTVTVGFSPVAAGSFTGAVIFASNGGNLTNTVTGTGAIVPSASFNGSPTIGPVPLAVAFNDTSTGTITSRFWDFGDGNTINTTTNSVSHTYNIAGTNTVTLIVSGPVGVSTNTQANYIVVTNPPPLVAGFSGSPTNGVVPLAVTFTDTSTGTITNRFWSFGDGATTNTTATGMSHTYGAGTYTVSLTVSGLGGSDTSTQTNYIVAITPAHLVISPASLNYGTVAVGQSSNQTFSVINTGQQTLTGSASVESPFAIISGGPYSVPGNGTNTVTVGFSPVAAGSFTGAVIFASNGGNSTNTVTGTVITGNPTNVWVSATSGKWETAGNWSLGQPSVVESILLITNAGSKTVTIDAVTTNAPGTLTISDLTVSAPGGTTNTVLLDNAGAATQLQVLNVLLLETNGAMVVNNSAVLASNSISIGNSGGDSRLTITNGGALVSGYGHMGYNASSSNNSALVSGSGSVWTNSGLCVGGDGSGNSMVISNGGTVVVNNWFGRIGNLGNNNSVVVSGSGSVWTNSSLVFVGLCGSGNSLVITNGGRVVDLAGTIGWGITSTNNRVLVSGSGSLWSGSLSNLGNYYLQVGYSGSGNSMVINNGGTVVSAGGYIGFVSSNNSVVVSDSGSVWSNSGGVVVGSAWTTGDGSGNSGNSLVISNGGKVDSAGGIIGDGGTNNSVVVSGSGSVWSNLRSLYVGGNWGGGNSLVITNGGQVLSGNSYVGYYTGSSNNSVCIADDAVWRNNILHVGELGTSNTAVVAGGSVLATNLVIGVASTTCDNWVQLDSGSLIVTNATHDAVLEVRLGKFILNGGTLQADKLVMTNACGRFIRNGGTLIVGNLVLDPNLDADGDGLPNGWEMTYGLDPLDARGNNGADGDPDGDGFTNLQEYERGTDPTKPPPASPSGLIATTISTNQINLSWTDNSINEDGFAIERAPDSSGSPGAWTQIATVGANVTNYNDTGLLPNTTYWYRVRAYSVGGDSDYSNQASAATPALCPRLVIGWGNNYSGQATPPAGLEWVTAIAVGPYHSLALKIDGTVVGWGYNNNGQATPPAGLSNVVAIAAGDLYSLALKSDGTVIGWGFGSGATPPVGLSNVVAVAAGRYPSLALKRDGTVVSWGYISSPPPGLSNVVAIAANEDNGFALKSDGTVFSWPYGSVPAGLSNVVAISAGGSQALALKRDGTVVNWGGPTPPVGLSNVVAVAACWWGGCALALKSDGTVVGWGDASTSPPAGLNRVIAIGAGYSYGLALTLPCSLSAPSSLTATAVSLRQINLSWLDNSGDEDGFKIERATSDGGPWTQIARIPRNTMGYHDANLVPGTTYYYRVRACNSGGDSDYSNISSASTPALCPTSVVGWGSGLPWPPAGLSNVMAIAVGYNYGLALKSDGTVVNWGGYTLPASLSNVVAIAAGDQHSLGLKSDGTVTGWGNNGNGQATPPTNLTGVVAVAAGFVHSLALKSDGTVVGWGDNSFGQATPPTNLTGVVAIAARGFQSLGLKSDGTVVGWGSNNYGERTPPAGLSGVVAIAAGGSHSLALKSDGTVVGWGSNNYGERTPPAGLSGVVAIAAGGQHSLALKSGGTVVGWGSGLGTPPSGLTGVVAIAAGGSYSLAVSCAPGTPLGLAATAITTSQINLSWTSNYSNEDRFRIERSTSSTGPWTEIGSVDSNVTMYSDTGVSCGQTYYYRVRACNGAGCSPYSNTANRNTSVVDADCDGIPDSWMLQYFGHATGQESDHSRATDDADGDGNTNLQEFLAGTDPTNSISYWRIQASPTNGLAPLTVSFTDNSTGSSITNRLWDFGDGGTSGDTNPSHTYTSMGKYSVGLTVFNLYGTTTLVASNLITVSPASATWTNANASGNWSDSSSWDPVAIPDYGSSVVFGSAGETVVVDNVSRTVSNITFSRSGDFYVAASGGASLTINNGITAATNFTYTISAPVVLGAANLWLVSNDATLQVSGPVSGTNSIIETGGGTLILSGTNTYSGGTAVSNGTLLVNNTVGSGTGAGAVTVVGGGTLGGNGVIEGPVVIAYGSLLSPGDSVGTLTISNNLVIDHTSVLQYELGTNSDLTVVSDNLTLGGTLNITDAGGFTNGTYTLFSYGGTLTYNGVAIGTAPSGYNYAIDTDTAGQVTLTVSTKPVILTQPADQTVYSSQLVTVNFSVTASGAQSYQWRKNGSNLTDGGEVSGANTRTLTLTNVKPWDAGIYTVVVGNGACSVTSSYAVLRVWTPSSVVVWGCNDHSQTSVPAGLTNAVAIATGGYHSLALEVDSTVVAWGYNSFGQCNVPADLTNVVAIAGGAHHSLALKTDATVVAWGWDNFGQTDVPADLTNAVAIAAGGYHNLALKADGTVVAWGWNDYGQCNVPADLTNAVAIAAGNVHSLAVKADGTVVAWGWNDYGQCSVPTDLTNVMAIAGGGYHSLALKADGTVVAWGYNGDGETDVPADLTNAVAIAVGFLHSLALKADGTVVAWGWNDYGQTDVPLGLSNVAAIGAGYCHNLALGNLPPVAGFSGSPTNGVAPLEVTFTDTSTGMITNRFWDFGDGTTTNTTLTSLTHTYACDGAFSVSLTVSGPGGSDTSTKPGIITVTDTTPPVIVACAAAVTTAANGNCQAAVPDFTAGVQAADNCTASDALVKTQSPAAGTLVGIGTTPVTITVKDAAGNAATCNTSFTVSDMAPPTVVVCAPAVTNVVNASGQVPVPDFTASVQATDNCTASNALVKTQSPTAGTLVGIGTTPVTITVKDAAGNATACGASFTVVGIAPWANFTGAPRNGRVPLVVTFSNLSTGTITAVAWNFGDGCTSTATNPTHTYTNAATFSVSLTVIGPAGSNTLNRSGYIMVAKALPPVITAGPTVTNALLQIGSLAVVEAGDTNVFTVGAKDPGGNPLSYRWLFGDGVTNVWSPLSTAQHVYTTNYCGPYAASVTVSNGWTAISSNLKVAVACQLIITKMQVTLNFARPNADSCSLSAILDLGAGFNPANKQVMLDIGGAQVPFTLDVRGRGVSRFGSCALAYNKKTGLWALDANLAKGSWQTQWAAYGLKNRTVPKPGVRVTMPVVVLVGDEAFADERLMFYTAIRNQSGSAK